MKTIHLFIFLSVFCLLVMILVDYIIGPKAEFLNAFSVVQRLLGQIPSAGNSMIAQKLGSAAELGVVFIVNLLLGGILTAIARLFLKS